MSLPPSSKSKGETDNLKYGLCADHNSRIFPKQMEDAHSTLLNIPSLENWNFFGVFDGHGYNGDEISDYLSKELLNSILNADIKLFKFLTNPINTSKYNGRLKKAIIKGFLDLDAKMRALFNDIDSTAVACLISPTHINLLNCGDSRGIIVSDNQIKMVTHDHKSEGPIENKRIVKAGGIVELHNSKNYVNFQETILNMSRTFCNYVFKSNRKKDKLNSNS